MGSVRSTPIDTQAPSTCCFLSGGSTDELLCGCLLQAVTASRVCVCVCVVARRSGGTTQPQSPRATTTIAHRPPPHDDRVAIGPTHLPPPPQTRRPCRRD